MNSFLSANLWGRLYNISKSVFAGMKGRNHSEDAKKKLSKMNTGDNHPMYGKTFPEELCEKISKAHKGKTLSEEHKRKISEAHKDKELSDEHKEKLAEVNSGESAYYYGEELSDEHKRKMSEAHKGNIRPNEVKKKISEANKGSKNDMAKLCKGEVVEIRQRYKNENITYRELSKDYPCGKNHIGHIVTGRKWSHVDGPIKGKDY